MERKMVKFVFAFPLGDHQASLHDITLTLVESSQTGKMFKKQVIWHCACGDGHYEHRPPLHQPLKN